jgi:KUP system potassium uptake protein
MEDNKLSKKQNFLSLALGSVGVVFGDIGTSPFYAIRESLSHVRHGMPLEEAVVGVTSLIVWALILIVSVKYVIFLMRADNNGEGGTLALMTIAQKFLGKASGWAFFAGILGAAFFYGDGIITPAVSVLGAIEGLKLAPSIGESLTPFIPAFATIILIALFLVQSKGTHIVAQWFGPITLVWFVALAWLGMLHIFDDKSLRILAAINPLSAVSFIMHDGMNSLVVLGAVFLAVTGAEALYADMGHFGKNPIRAAWFVVAFPCLAINYFGQGAYVIAHAEAAKDPFWMMVPHYAFWPIMVLATLAAIIASQAVITGAFSVTQQAVQLGLLPRMQITRTSETQAGQIYVSRINSLLLIGVLFLVFIFKNSSALTYAYGMAITGTMLISTLLAIPVIAHLWKWRLWQAILLFMPFLFIDSVFISAQLLKIPHGAWMPLALGGVIVIIIFSWTKGSHLLAERSRKDSVPLMELLKALEYRPVHRVRGMAVFLTSDINTAPVALTHNLKHNHILHENIIIMKVETTERPRVEESKRLEIIQVSDDIHKVIVRYGFMESPNIPKAMNLCRQKGLKFDIMSTSFFLGRRKVVAGKNSLFAALQIYLFIFLMKNSTNATDFFKIPSGRVVELGTQVVI